MYPKATLTCSKCGHTARRRLLAATACHGHRETPTEPATCPRCGIAMRRADKNLRYSADEAYGITESQMQSLFKKRK